jgi:triosephosphate isomerase
MRFPRAFTRIIFGLTFIFSGFMKLIDPVGTMLIVQENLAAMHLGFFSPLSMAGGAGLATVELVLGVSILSGFRMKVMSWVGLALMTVFTIKGIWLVIANPISDCGCFGQFIHLTNWQSLIKNFILLACIIFIVFQRDRYEQIAAPWAEWVFVGAFACVGLFIAISSIVAGPRADFTPFKSGANLAEAQAPKYLTTFIYEKDGTKKEFAIDNLPDSTWAYVEAKTKQIAEEGSNSAAGFAIYDSSEADVTGEVLSGKQLLVSYYNAKDFHPDRLPSHVTKLASVSDSLGVPLNVLLALPAESVPTDTMGIRYFSADRKTLLTLNRSNGGVTYLYEGEVIRKWSPAFPPTGKRAVDKILNDDPEEIQAKESIFSNIYSQAGLFLIIVAAVLVREFARKASENNKRRRAAKAAPAEESH